MSFSAWLAFAADLYIPLLAVFYLKRLLCTARISRAALICLLLVNLVIAWGLMLADLAFTIWPAWELDYSTHTAVSLAFLVGLCCSAPRQTLLWILSLVLYAALMRALDYHSLADIMSTVAVTGTLMGSVGIWIFRNPRARRSPPE